jgi:hypothetical protein
VWSLTDEENMPPKQNLAKKLKKIQDSKTYAENMYFSQRNRQWFRFAVQRPRLPKAADKTEKWLETKFQPRTLRTFIGKHNNEV